ncbi:hypothetical protein Tco_0554252 [Tanacetum coccineum]
MTLKYSTYTQGTTCVSLAPGVTPRPNSSVRVRGWSNTDGIVLSEWLLLEEKNIVNSEVVSLGFWDEDNLYRSVILASSSGHHYIAFQLSVPVLQLYILAAVNEYCIPLDLHPRLLPPGMMMNRLLSRYIGLYIEQLEQGGLRVPFSSFFLAVIRHFSVHFLQLVLMVVDRGHWFSFENKTGCGTKKYLKEVTSSLKGWKKKFFLLDRHAILDAMPWRYGDTDFHDDFLTTYNENDDAHLSESKKKQKVQEHNEPTQFGSEGTLSVTPLYQAAPEVVKKPTTVASEASPHVKKEVVDLSGNTRVSTPPIMNTQPSPHLEHQDAHVNIASNVHSPQSSHQGNEDELLISHLATPTEDDFLGSLLNMEVISHAYQTLGQSVMAQGELLKRHDVQRASQDNEGLINKLALLESAHSGCESQEKELVDRLKDLERERDEWHETASDMVEKIRSLEKYLKPKTQRLAAAEEKIRALEGEKLYLSAELDRA